MAKHTLTIGRIVHYSTGHGPQPAVVVHVHGNPLDGGGLVNLQVFTNRPDPSVAHRTSVPYDPGVQAPGTWHWPDEARPEAPEAPVGTGEAP